jgi:hypothetical protein
MSHEIMEHDNMFSVGEVPWHGLGVVLPEAPSVDEELRETLNLGVARFEASAEQYAKLARARINQDDLTGYIRAVLETEDETPRERAIMDVLLNGRGLGVREQDVVTYWDAYNAINEWMLWQRGQTADNRLASAWFGDGYILDRRAFDYAVKLAA